MSQRIEISGRRLLGCIGASLALGAVAVSGGAWAQSSAPVDATKIVVGIGQTGTAQVPLFIADQEGFFKKAGLDVSTEMLSGGTPSAMASFASGAVNILNLSGPELIEYVGQKVISGKAFGEIADQSFDIAASKGITSIQDIKGKTIGISSPNSGDWIYFLGLLQHYGIAPTDVTFITSGTPASRVAALAAGAIQVTALANNLRAQASKVGTIILKSGDSPVQFPTSMFIANNDLITNHKPALKKFLAVLSQTTTWMRANPAAAAADCAKAVGSTVQACADSIALNFDRSISSPYTWSTTFAANVDGIKSSLAVMAIVQPDTKNLTVDDVADTSIAGTSP